LFQALKQDEDSKYLGSTIWVFNKMELNVLLPSATPQDRVLEIEMIAIGFQQSVLRLQDLIFWC